MTATIGRIARARAAALLCTALQTFHGWAISPSAAIAMIGEAGGARFGAPAPARTRRLAGPSGGPDRKGAEHERGSDSAALAAQASPRPRAAGRRRARRL